MHNILEKVDMRRLIRFLTILFLFSMFMFQGCEDKENPMFDDQAIWECHYENNWDYETTKNNVVGLWEWKYIKCCGETTTPYQNGTESKGLKIEFSADGSGVVVDQDVIYEFSWDLGLLVNENGLFEFQTTPSIAQLNGRLLFCDNLMMSNGSYRDGADNFLVKVDSDTTK